MKKSVREEDLMHLFLYMLRRDGMLQHYVTEYHRQHTNDSALPVFFRKMDPQSWVAGAFMWPTDNKTWEYYRDLYQTWTQIVNLVY